MKINLSEAEAKGILDSVGISIEDIVAFYPNITKRVARPSSLGISTRNFFHWSQKDLIDNTLLDETEKGNWRKLTLSEVLWLKIVEVLRDFGFPIKEIQTIRKSLHKNLFDLASEYADDVFKLLDESLENEALKKVLQEFILFAKKSPELMSEQYKILSTVIGTMISEILLHRSNIKLIIYKEKGQFWIAMEGYTTRSYSQNTIDRAKKLPHISISINDLIAEFVENDKDETCIAEFGLIRPEEKEIIDALRDGKVREIVIKKDNDDNLTITCTETSKIIDDVKLIKRLFGMNQYSEVRVVLRNEKELYVESKTKIKIRTPKTAPIRKLPKPLDQRLLGGMKPDNDNSPKE